MTNCSWRVTFDGTTVGVYLARDPVTANSWQPIYAETASSFLVAPNFFGVAVQSQESVTGTDLNLYGFTGPS
jgi:hypothetical protein